MATVLREHGATLNFAGKQAGVLMCQVFQASLSLKQCFHAPALSQAASAGKFDEVRRLVENGVSASASDYDKRTGLVIPFNSLL